MRRRHGRLTAPLIRRDDELVEAGWDEALGAAAEGLSRFGGDSFGMFSCSKATNEVNYVAQKWARSVMASNNIDSCNRT